MNLTRTQVIELFEHLTVSGAFPTLRVRLRQELLFPTTGPVATTVKEMLADEGKIPAIRLCKQLTGLSLMESKKYVESL